MQPDRSLSFERDGQAWPFREASRFVRAAGIDWHVQEVGEGPVVLLLHGTGAATHSWRALVPLLSSTFRVVAIDLPGHGFTTRVPSALLSLPGMANAVCQLLQVLEMQPALVIGHAAGAAVMIRMALDCRIAPKGLVAINGALTPTGGEAARALAPLVKLLVVNPVTPRVVAWQAGRRTAVQQLIKASGSTIDAAGVELYRTLVANSEHVAAALGMMAHWDLHPLSRDMKMLDIPLLLVTGAADKAIKPDDVFKVRAMAQNARVEMLRGLGHLAHEEAPKPVADLVRSFAHEVGAT